MLRYPSAAGFAQAIIQRRRALPPERPLVVVEGATDRRALLPHFAENVQVIPAGGRPNAIAAFHRAKLDGMMGVLVIIDCDGDTPLELKGHHGLVISTNRDLEADLLLELDAMRRFACEVLADSADDGQAAKALAGALLRSVQEVAVAIERVRSAARRLGIGTRMLDAKLGRRRKIRPTDLAGSLVWVSESQMLKLEEVTAEYGALAGWSAAEMQAVAVGAQADAGASCCRHESPGCEACETRCLCNGHDLVDLLTIGVNGATGLSLKVEEVDRSLRIAADARKIASWEVAKRAKRWASNGGFLLFEDYFDGSALDTFQRPAVD